MMAAGNNSIEREECKPNRRVYPRHPVDCIATITVLTGAGQISGRLVDLSLGGCRLATEQRVLVGIMVRVEVQFQLRGIAFRVVGVAAGTRTGKSFAIRFLDMPKRRYDELVEVIAEVEAAGAVKASTSASPMLAASPMIAGQEHVEAALASSRPSTSSQAPATQSHSNQSSAVQVVPAASGDRRSHSRHSVDTRAKLLLVKGGISMPGRILNLSQGGCRLRTDERFNVGIYVRVEAEFYLHGLPFRLAGVSQAILDKNTIGVRFLDMSERRREQLTELIAEIAEAERCSVSI
jgi:c-di-GMP-binding flagellar brake protein YcgR